MDELQQSIYVDRFRLAFHTKKGTVFQDWFVLLAGHALGSDFEEVRPYGLYGDLKCDGRRISSGSVFQCYAPDAMKEADTANGEGGPRQEQDDEHLTGEEQARKNREDDPPA